MNAKLKEALKIIDDLNDSRSGRLRTLVLESAVELASKPNVESTRTKVESILVTNPAGLPPVLPVSQQALKSPGPLPVPPKLSVEE